MTGRFHLFAIVLVVALPHSGIAAAPQADYPIMERVAKKLIQKYQTSSCQDFAAQKSAQKKQSIDGPTGATEKRAVEMLHQDPSCAPRSSAGWRLPSLTICFSAT